MKRKANPLIDKPPLLVKKRNIVLTTIEYIPIDCLRIILDFAAPRDSHRKLLSRVCKMWSKVINISSPSFNLNLPFPVQFLFDSACEGLANWCEYAWTLCTPHCNEKYCDDISLLNHALTVSADYGQAVTCFWARSKGAEALEAMTSCAARNGDKEICALAREWGLKIFSSAIKEAATNGYNQLCETLRGWTLLNIANTTLFVEVGRDIANTCLIEGARGGNLDLVKKAMKWGPRVDWAMILEIATQIDHGEIAKIAMSKIWWGWSYSGRYSGPGVGMVLAARFGKKNVWMAARSLGGSEWDYSIWLVGNGPEENLEDRKEICRMAMESGGIIPTTTDFYPDFDVYSLTK